MRAALRSGAGEPILSKEPSSSGPVELHLLSWQPSAGWGAECIPLIYAFTDPEASGSVQGGRVEAVMRQIIRHYPEFVCRALSTVFYRYAG